MKFKITNTKEIMDKLQSVGINTVRKAWDETVYTSAEMEQRSYNNRPWTDRTGNARASIYGLPEFTGTKMSITHGIGVDYGVYLELSNGGRYRIIGPTTDSYRSVWLANMKDILSK
mgnify:CR=1 FL=1